MTDLPWYFLPAALFCAFMTIVGALTIFTIVHDLITGHRDPVRVSHRVVSRGRG